MTSKHPRDSVAIKGCLALSLLVHLVFSAPLDFFKPFKLGTAVLLNQPIAVDLQQTAASAPAKQSAPLPPGATVPSVDRVPETAALRETIPVEGPGPGKLATEAAPTAAREVTIPPPVELPAEPAAGRVDVPNDKLPTTQGGNALSDTPPPIRNAAEFLATDRETLIYRISMLGVPVGDAQMEAKQEKGEVWITLRIRSNPAISQLYPVDDSVETRHIGGNFILSRIRQREGSFIGDRGFTLFLRDKSVFWIDRVKNRSIQEPLPNSSVVDILSGLYYLRNQPLEVGRPVVLQLFDSNHYAPTTVAVLRKERLTLPGFREVDTLVIQPQLTTEGIFRRTGDILIWLTDDVNKVPVKVETRVPLGKVTAELVSAQTYRHGEIPASDGPRAYPISENPGVVLWQSKSDPGH
jgi:hypothetical protein